MQIRVRLNLTSVPLLAWDVDSIRKMVSGFCLIEKVSTKTLVGRDLSAFEITALCDQLEDIPNTIFLTLGSACYTIAVHIYNATIGRQAPSDIAP